MHSASFGTTVPMISEVNVGFGLQLEPCFVANMY